MGRAPGVVRVIIPHEAAHTGFPTSVSVPWGVSGSIGGECEFGAKRVIISTNFRPKYHISFNYVLFVCFETTCSVAIVDIVYGI